METTNQEDLFPYVRETYQSGYPYHLVAQDAFPAANDPGDQAVLKRYRRLCSPMYVAALPSLDTLDSIRRTLICEFPWATHAISHIMDELLTRKLFGSRHLHFKPVVLTGDPGVGKTRLARRLAEELDVAFRSVSLAGMDDSRVLSGTSRGWSTGQPSPLLDLMIQADCATAVVLLDEVEKAGGRATNTAQPWSVLLNLLESESSRRWFDHFLQVNCDISTLIFIATANEISDLPAPLLSRLTVLNVDTPSPEQIIRAIPHALHDISRDWNVDIELLPLVRAEDLPFIPKSMRTLKAVVAWYLTRWAQKNLRPEVMH